MRTYYIGLIDNNKLPFGRKRTNTVTLQAVSNKDCLSPDLWQYFGERETTKKDLKSKRTDLLREINKSYGTNFEKININ